MKKALCQQNNKSTKAQKQSDSKSRHKNRLHSDSSPIKYGQLE